MQGDGGSDASQQVQAGGEWSQTGPCVQWQAEQSECCNASVGESDTQDLHRGGGSPSNSIVHTLPHPQAWECAQAPRLGTYFPLLGMRLQL